MKKTLFQKVMCFVLSVATLFGAVGLTVAASDGKKDYKGKEFSAAKLNEMQALVNTNSYADYIASYIDSDQGSAKETITLTWEDLIKYDKSKYEENDKLCSGEDVQLVKDSEICQASDRTSWDTFENSDYDWENAIFLPATGRAVWSLDIGSDMRGLYYIKINYYSCYVKSSNLEATGIIGPNGSSISTIERKLYIDDVLPFSEAAALEITKYWVCSNIVSKESKVTGAADSYDVKYEHIDDQEPNSNNGWFKIVTEVSGGVETVTKYQITQDINGNSMLPNIDQVSAWNSYYCQDSTGYETDYFMFYIPYGDHTLTLEAEREPMVISSIELIPVENATANIPTYEEVKQSYKDNGYTAPSNGTITILEAEFPDYVSDSAVYSTNDNSSAVTTPSISNAQLHNVIGENSYNTVGQWAAYKFRVNESGLYKFGLRYKQTALQGMYICRAIKLSGGQYGNTPVAPFAEAYNAQFDYNKKWQTSFIADGSGEAFEFYFEEGEEYTVYLECSLGSLKELIQRVENSLDVINDCYLKILQLTGNDPDEYRDYNFYGIMPEVLYNLLEQAIELDKVKTEFEALCGTAGSHTTTLQTIAILLNTMGSDKGEHVAANMSTLKSYLGTLGTWINNSKASKLIVDNISVCPADYTENELLKKIPAKPGFFKSIGFEIASFFYSFFTNYDQMGLKQEIDENDPTKVVEVWLASGRDQSQIWRTMIDANDGFTAKTGMAVKLKLVTGGTLLPSILSGKGPDVYMGLGSSDVINYAIRDAVLGVSSNQGEIFSSNYYTYIDADGKYNTIRAEDYKPEYGQITFETMNFDDVIGDYFAEAAMDTIRLRGVTYGIPQTMSFAMMFYRMDILAELGEEVPQSWDQLLALLPVLQTNNMTIGINYIAAIDFMIYQMGGNMWKYTDNEDYAGAQIALDENIALEAFDKVCRFYSEHSFPVSYDAANRFRTGEMPIVVGDYAGIYNQLVVYATEIAGLWEFTSLPGVEREDGTFNYDSLAGVGAAVMLHGCENVLGAWQYMQWETSADVQANYGNKMVALIGPSAKYESANLKAMDNLSWTASEKEAINEQMAHLSSIVNYPGSYIINRYTKFAFLAAVNDGANAVDALNGYIDAINTEITRKRTEFNLPTLGTGEVPPGYDG